MIAWAPRPVYHSLDGTSSVEGAHSPIITVPAVSSSIKIFPIAFAAVLFLILTAGTRTATHVPEGMRLVRSSSFR